jgi:hypothetical protein
MAQSAFAYQQPARRERPQQQPQRQPLRVLPGTRTRPEVQQGLAPIWRVLFVTGIVMVLFFGAIWLARVALSEAAMELLVRSEQTTQNIEALRSEGSKLEVAYSVASNPQTIQEAATKLGMAPDPQVDYLNVPIGE